MSDSDNKGMTVAPLPTDLMKKIIHAAGHGTCPIDTNGDGHDDMDVSVYEFFKHMAENPDLYTEAWEAVLGDIGLGAVESTVGYGAIALAGPLAPFVALASVIAAPFFGKNRIGTLVLANETDGAMRKKEVFQDCGWQSGHPVYKEVDPETGAELSSNPDVIPARQKFGSGQTLSGVGLYRFEKNLDLVIGFYGTSGAISFTFDDPKIKNDMAIGWEVPETGSPYYSATNDLSKYASLEDFWSKTIDERASGEGEHPAYAYSRKGYTAAELKGLERWGISGPYAPEGPAVLINEKEREYPDDPNDNDMIFTAVFFNERPGDDYFDLTKTSKSDA